MTTKNHEAGGSIRHEAAIDELVKGASITDAAAASGYTREQLSRLLNHNPIFKARLNERRADIRASIKCDVQGLIGEITAAIRDKLKSADVPPGVVLQSGLVVLPKLYALIMEPKPDVRDAEEIIRDEQCKQSFWGDRDVAREYEAAKAELRRGE
jgi:hypothetical protein